MIRVATRSTKSTAEEIIIHVTYIKSKVIGVERRISSLYI